MLHEVNIFDAYNFIPSATSKIVMKLSCFKEELRTKFVKEQSPVFLADLEKLLVGNNGGDGFFVGEEVHLFFKLVISFNSGCNRIPNHYMY